MKFSKVHLHRRVLCKDKKHPELFSVAKLRYSKDFKAVLVHITLYGEKLTSYSIWKDVEELEKNWEVFDEI